MLFFIGVVSSGILFVSIYRLARSKRRKKIPYKQVRERLEKVYDNVFGFEITPAEESSMLSEGNDPTYGEIVYDSMYALIGGLKIRREDVFYDLGSGAGKFVAYVHMATKVKKSAGIEVAETRHQKAEDALKRMKDNGFIDETRQIEFICDDITEADLSDATIVFMCSTCFSGKILQKLVDKFVDLAPGLRIITLRELPKHPQLKFIQKEFFSTSWSKSSPFYFYLSTTPPSAPSEHR